MRYTQATLKKLEALFTELGYSIRYEKGHFQSGYCLVEQRKIAVVNRFLDTEGRIHCLMDMLATIPIDAAQLSEPAQLFLQKIQGQPSSEDNTI